MPEMKICPNCGKEILAVAKKCKYCGTWIEPKHEFRCPICCEVIPEDSVICPVCHERLRPDPEPEPVEVPEPVKEDIKIEPVPEQVLQSGAHSSGGKKWLFIILAVLLAAGLVAFLLLKPKSGNSTDNEDAKALHEWFFDNLGTTVTSISTSPELQARLTKLVGKKTVSKIEGLLSKTPSTIDSNVGIMHDEDGTDVFSLVGAPSSALNNDSFIIKYIDYGISGYLDVVTLFNGSRKAVKESIKEPGTVSPIVRQWEYSGSIGKGRSASNVEFTLWVDGPGDAGDPVRGFYRYRGNTEITMLDGVLLDGGILSLSESNGETMVDHFEFQFHLDKTMDKTTSLKGVMSGNYGHSDEDDGSPQGYFEEPVILRRSGGNPIPEQMADGVKTVAFDGLIYDDDHSYPIEMSLDIENEGGWDDKVTGSYRYKSQPENNRIELSGIVYSEKGAVFFLDLESEKGSERFSFTFTENLVDLEGLDGKWYKLKDGEIEKELNVSVTR